MIYVYYYDGHCGTGDHGLKEFSNEPEAEQFILQRLKEDTERKLKQYKVIGGEELIPRIIEVAEKIELNRKGQTDG